MAAGLATLDLISAPGFFATLHARCGQLVDGLNAAGREAGVPFSAQHQGGMAGLYFRATPPSSFAEAQQQDLDRFKRFYHLMLEAGVYLPPSPVEAFFFSSVHSDDDIAHTVAAARRSLAAVA